MCLTGQVGFFLLLLSAGTFVNVFLLSCNAKNEETPVIPPVTSPLSQAHIGFGVINVSYINVNTNPAEAGNSLGYLRRGAVVLVHERRQINTGGKTELWLLVEGAYKGWLKETLIDVYENEEKAQTASNSMNK